MSTFFNPQTLAALARQRRGVPPPHVDDDNEPYTDAATVESNLQRIGSQPYVGNGMFRPQEQAPDRAARILSEGTTNWDLPERRVQPMELEQVRPDALARVGRIAQPADTVTPTPAPLDLSRTARAPILHDVINEGLNSPYAASIRTAMEARRNDAASQPHGFWGKIGRVLGGVGEGIREGFLRGGANGALIGGIAGGVSPKYADKLSDEREFARRYPENVQGENLRFRQMDADRRQTAEQRQLAILERQNEVARKNAENIDFDNQLNRDRENRLTAEKQAEMTRLAQNDTFNRQKSISDQQADVVGKQGGLQMPTLADYWMKPDARALANRNQGGYVANLEEGKPAYRLPSQSQQDTRKLQQVQNESRAREAADFEKYLKMRPFKLADSAAEERQKAEIKASYDSAKADLSGVPTLKQFEDAKAEAKALATRADNARKGGDVAAADKLQAQANEAYGKASAYHSAMMESGGYEDNSGGGWVGVRRKAQTKRGSAVGNGSRSASAPSSTQQIFPAAKLDAFAAKKFNNDRAAAEAYLQAQGWKIQ